MRTLRLAIAEESLADNLPQDLARRLRAPETHQVERPSQSRYAFGVEPWFEGLITQFSV